MLKKRSKIHFKEKVYFQDPYYFLYFFWGGGGRKYEIYFIQQQKMTDLLTQKISIVNISKHNISFNH